MGTGAILPLELPFLVVPIKGGNVHGMCRKIANLRAVYRHEEGTVRKELMKGATVVGKAALGIGTALAVNAIPV
jgi:hypothetical protein